MRGIYWIFIEVSRDHKLQRVRDIPDTKSAQADIKQAWLMPP